MSIKINPTNVQTQIYFQNKLYQCLNVPASRMKSDNGMNFGRQAEITRDELKFSKFVSRLRMKFGELFDDLLRTQLLLKGVMSEQDWESIKEEIYYDFTQDAYIAESKQAEIMRNRIDLLNAINPYVGTYFSREFVYNDVLHMSEEEIDKLKTDLENDTELQQQLQAQSQSGPGAQQAAAVTRSISGNTPQPYNADNPMVEDAEINKITLLKTGAIK